MEEKRLIYQVLPRLFGNTKGKNVHNGSITENGCGKLNDFTPSALRYIREMGFNHIWYTGIIEHAHQTSYQKYGIAEDYPEIVKGKAGSPYAIKDYYDIDPDLAVDVPNRMAEFEALIHRTKEAGLKVIIDFVPNHLARHYTSDAKPKGTPDFGDTDDKSKSFDRNNNFYYFPNNEFLAPVEIHGDRRWFENPAKVTGNDAFTPSPSINDWYETVKLNYGVDIQNNNHPHFNPTPDTWFKMYEILKYWAAKGVDGFRCDMAEMVPPQFWNWAINQIKRDNPNIIFIAEVYNPALYRQYIFDGKFDYLYDKVGLYDTLRNVMTGSQSASEITRCWQSTSDILQHMLYFNENHDEQRIASSFFSGNAEAGKPAMLVASSLTRNPYMLYFGQEIGEAGMDEEGFSGQDGKTTIFDYWQIDKIARLNNGGKFDDALLTPEEIALKTFHKNVLTLFKEHEAMRKGYFYDLVYANLNNPRFDAQKTFIFFRHTDNEVLLVIAHFGNYSYDARILIPQHALETAGLGSEEFFRGTNLLNPKEHILFDKQLLVVNGFGVEIKPYSGMIFKIK